MSAARRRAEAMARASSTDWDALKPESQQACIQIAEAQARELDAYFAHTRFVEHATSSSGEPRTFTWCLKPEPTE